MTCTVTFTESAKEYFMNTTTKQIHYTFPTVGTIQVWAGSQLVKVFIGDRRSDFVAACVINGTIWFETAATGINALIDLTERISKQGA
jgi:hypothetical protein